VGNVTLLSVRDVSKVYNQGQMRVIAVNHVSLDVCTGEVTLILGPSGSGKTTLLTIMGGLLRPTHGEVFLEGKNVYLRSDRDLSRLRCNKIGFVFQNPNLLSFLTVQKNVEVVMNLAGVGGRKARERAIELLCQVQSCRV
jgi:putative ABC transport system ATP-binding protein